MSLRACLLSGCLASVVILEARAEIRVEHAYRLGEADPGAQSGAAGFARTIDSGRHQRSLDRIGQPGYSDDAAPITSSTLSMRFVPANGAGYFAPKPALTARDNFGMEVWVKARTRADDGEGRRLVVYNGFPLANGFGIRQTPSRYELVFTKHQTIASAPAPPGEWVHLAYVRDGGRNRFFVNGEPVPSVDAVPVRPDGKTMIGATVMDKESGGVMPGHFFDGWIDEVRFFTFKPGRFDPALDLDFHRR